MAGERTLLRFYHILRNYNMSNVETCSKYLSGERCTFIFQLRCILVYHFQVRRFLEFDGVGIKIATMAVNILAREFKIPMKDYINIDISPDVHAMRVFKRLGFISKDASNDELIYCARELNPMYPGIFDLSCWEIGRHWCRPNKTICEKCYLNNVCNKKI